MERVPLLALASSLATAAGIHLAVGVEHDFEGVHGMFFAVAGVIQAVGAVVVALRPTLRLVALAAVGSTALLASWIVERTPGLAGGDAFDALAVATATAELVTVVAAVRLLARPVASRGRWVAMAALGLVALVAVGSAGFADSGHGDHHAPEVPVVANGRLPEPRSEPAGPSPLPSEPAGEHHHDDEDATPHDH